jgi:hypothetical protein
MSNVEKRSRQSGRTPMGEPVTKSLDDINDKTMLDKVHEEPETTRASTTRTTP